LVAAFSVVDDPEQEMYNSVFTNNINNTHSYFQRIQMLIKARAVKIIEHK